VLVIVDPALGPEPLATLRAAAPPEVVVVDSSAAPDAIAAASPRLVIGVGTHPLDTATTPRGRIGLVLPAGTPAPPGAPVDVLWYVTPASGKPFWTELADKLPALAAGAAAAAGAKRR
jgi:hypothetical protein